MSENNKTIIFDYAKNVLSEESVSNVEISFEICQYSEEDTQKILGILYKNDFRINSKPAVIKSGESFAFSANSFVSQDYELPILITLSMETYDIEEIGEFSINMNIESKDDYVSYIIYFRDEAVNQYKTYDNVATTINSNMESFMLLRTNPKLTGNIKLVATDNNLYLDTFKVSTTSVLNNKKYRRKSISADGDYPYDVYKAFHDVPAGEMYSVYEDSYDPHKHYYDISLQIENIYEYGAEYNNDNMYSENMKILAPLYIGKHLPTYFAIFKSDRLFTADESASNSDIFRSMIVQSQCIKIFDLRRNTTLGKYLHGYQDMISSYLAGTCALQFIEQEYDKGTENYRQGRNVWKGVAIDKGILTDKTETTYFATDILNNSIKPQEDYNMFLLNGYSRNMLLYPNILNLEYMFNDEYADDMSMHNYYGLYLTENEFIHFNQVIKSKESDGNYKMNYYDKNNKVININETSIDVIDNPEYTDRIFFASTLNTANYLAVKDDIDLFVKNNVANKASENIVQIPGTKIMFGENAKSFITLDFTKQIKYGEHFKFTAVDAQYKDDKFNVTIELIASNDYRLVNATNHINPYVLTNNSERVLDDVEDDKNKIYRITFYTQDLNDSTIPASLEEQLERMRYAIQKVNSFLTVSNYDEETIGLISTQENVYFLHILADEVMETSTTAIDPVRCFNYNNVTYATLNENIPDLYRLEDMPFANNGFELIGKRFSNITKFAKLSKTTMVFYEIEKDLYEELQNVEWPLIATVEGYQPMIMFNTDNGELVFTDDINGSKLSFEDIITACVTSPWNVKKCLIASPYEASSPNGYINISSPMPCSISLMGINSIKDIDMQVDINEYTEHKTGISATFAAGEMVPIDSSDPRIRKFVPYTINYGHIKGISTNSINSFIITDDMIFYSTGESVLGMEISSPYLEFDKDTEIALSDTNSIDLYDYATYRPVLREENYYKTPTDTANSKLDIPLVPLVNCQWKSNGVYYDSQSMLDVLSLFKYDLVGNFVQNIYTPAGIYNDQYVINSFKDYIKYNGEITTIEDFLQNSKYANAFKKFLTSNFKLDTAIGYYNAYVQTLEFIYYGVKFTFKLTSAKYKNEIKLNEFNNYEVYIINDYNASDTNDIYISTVEEFILIVNHLYKPGQLYSNSAILNFTPLEIFNAQYDWYAAPYNYLLLSSGVINDTLYFNKSDFYQLYDVDNISYMVEYDLPIYNNPDCGLEETNVYMYFNAIEDFSSYTKTDEILPYYDATNTLQYRFAMNYKYDDDAYIMKYSNDAIDALIKTYLNTTLDYRKHYTYFVKTNDNIEINEDTYSDMLYEFIAGFNAKTSIKIISQDSVKTINITDDYKPLSINISQPIRVKYNQGLFDPVFNDVFNFVINDSISDAINLDTLYANTQISSINSLRNYYHNKIMNANKNCTYNYFREDNHSPFSTNWDNALYRLYDDDTTFSTISGYQLGIDDKMMFGSKALVIHNDGIELSNWNYVGINKASIISSPHNANAKATYQLKIELNLTKTFYNYITSIPAFVNNWSNVDNLLNINVYINNYINNALSKIYNFRNNFDVKVYQLYVPDVVNQNAANSNANLRFIQSLPDNFNEYVETTNIETSFENINNEVILTISINDFDKYYFYPIVKINKI